jgi:hypothetical protein
MCTGVVREEGEQELAATSFGKIGKATLRLTAIRTYSRIGRAATRLEMAPVSLSRWIGRRKAADGGRVSKRGLARPEDQARPRMAWPAG